MQLVPPVLQRVVAKYRRDVHHLPSGAAPDALGSLETHLGQRLPSDLRRFLALHNGALLFRGALQLRSTAEITPASAAARGVVLFADAAGETRWAFGARPGGRHVFGTWDGVRLCAIYTTFVGWLTGEIQVLEARVPGADDRDQIRLEAAPDDPMLLARIGAAALRRGRPEEAEEVLALATQVDPGDARAWQLLGDALAIRDRPAARRAWLEAFRRTRTPLPWPGAPCLDADALRALSVVFPAPEAWERELRRFLTEQVVDVVDPRALAVVAATGRALARSLVSRGRRAEARTVLAELLSRTEGFTIGETPWHLVLDLVDLEIGLGHHDASEALLGRLRQQGPPSLRGAGLLRLLSIAVMRQEPWAEDIADSAELAGLTEADELAVCLLRIERAVRQQRPGDARRLLQDLPRRARRAGQPRLEALAALFTGDVARLAGRTEEADLAYNEGLALADGRYPDVQYRLLSRIAEQKRTAGAAEEAEQAALAVARGFATLALPVREGWALVRVARLVAERDPTRAATLRQAARERFTEADLAAGVAATDSLGGDPGRSLAWHLERSTAQARARHDARRSRPPLERADADRPERRLGAHRLAIAACSVSVVRALAREMDACVRAAGVGRGRATDPPVLRYVASVDLLSGHRSYEAATILIEHLLERGLDGVMLRALQGAIARSPNAALVDGLLRCVEAPGAHPSPAVCSAAELLGIRREPAAVRALMRVLGAAASPSVRKAATVALGRIGNRGAIDAILPALEDPRLAEHAALALLMLGDRRGVDFHGRALLQQRTDLSGSPGEIVGRYGGPDHLLLLMKAAGGEDDAALGALQGLGLMGDARGVPALLRALHARHTRIVGVASGALQILTGHEEDPDEPGVRARWHAWWEDNREDFHPGKRYRHGALWDYGQLIDGMGHRDPWVRRTSYDELVIASGQSLPFDADGPWRVQQHHLRAWRAWCAVAEQPPGHWMLDGAAIH